MTRGGGGRAVWQGGRKIGDDDGGGGGDGDGDGRRRDERVKRVVEKDWRDTHERGSRGGVVGGTDLGGCWVCLANGGGARGGANFCFFVRECGGRARAFTGEERDEIKYVGSPRESRSRLENESHVENKTRSVGERASEGLGGWWGCGEAWLCVFASCVTPS